MFRIDTADFRAFSDSCTRAIPTLRRNVDTQLLAAGSLIASDARSRCISTTTTITSAPMGPGVVAVRATGGPITGLLEDGNKKGGGGGQFRHPVFGNMDTWVNQPMAPYLRPAVEAHAADFDELISFGVEETLKVAADI